MNGKYWPHSGKCWYNACLYNPWLVFPLEQDDHSFVSFHSQLIFLYGVRTFSAFVCWFSPGTAASSHSPKNLLVCLSMWPCDGVANTCRTPASPADSWDWLQCPQRP